MINEADFQAIRDSLKASDETRESIIKKSRDVQRFSKQAIFSLHRGQDEEAAERLASAEKLARELLPLLEAEPFLRLGSYSNSMEEYAEARIFRTFLREKRLLASNELELVDREEYLGGLLDFTGELNRFAVARATVRDVAAVQLCRDLCDAIMGLFLQFDLRNGNLRKKYDVLKYTLRKMESTLYELSLLQGGLMVKPEDGPAADFTANGDGGGARDDV